MIDPDLVTRTDKGFWMRCGNLALFARRSDCLAAGDDPPTPTEEFLAAFCERLLTDEDPDKNTALLPAAQQHESDSLTRRVAALETNLGVVVTAATEIADRVDALETKGKPAFVGPTEPGEEWSVPPVAPVRR